MTRRNVSGFVLPSLPYVSLLGCVALVVTIIVAFEEPDTRMLFVSGCLLSAAPVGLLIHLALSKELSSEERREWLSILMSRRGLALFGDYFDSSARRRVTNSFSEDTSSEESGKS